MEQLPHILIGIMENLITRDIKLAGHCWTTYEDEDYVEMYSNGRWNDINQSNHRRGYVLEYNIPQLVLESASITNGIEGSTDSRLLPLDLIKI